MSAFYDLSSLEVAPSGYKSGKVYAQKPMTTDGQLTFTRASTATRVNASGLIETVNSGVPRLDYLGSTCPRLLLEPQRTNLVTYSEQFTNAAWTGGGATGVANQAVSPDGYTNADLIYPTSNGNFVGKFQAIAAATTGVVSCYVKQAGKRFAQLGTDNNATYTCAFDLQLGTVVRTATNYTATITSVGNGWFRITAAYVSSTAAAYPFIGVSDNAAGAITADGTNGLYVWGFQYETSASYATSYIPTLGSSVTRVADACSKTGISSLIGQTAGTIFAQWTCSNANPSGRILAISDGTFSNRVAILEDDGRLRIFVSTGSVTQADLAYSSNIGNYTGTHKIAVAYANNDLKVYVDGVAKATITTLNVPACSAVYVGTLEDGTSATALNGGVAQALLFKTRLTNAQLAELTSL